MEDGLETNLNNPHEMLATQGREIGDFAKPRSIAIIMYTGNVPGPDTYRELASGVLIRIQDKHFILTAGHCIKTIRRNHYTIILPIANYRTVFSPKILNSNYKSGNGCDWGYIEVTRQDAVLMESYKCVLMNLDRVQVIERSDTSLGIDSFILSGYPRELVRVNNKGISCQFAHFSTKTSQSEKVPSSPIRSGGKGVHVFDLVFPLDMAFNNVNGSNEKSFIPEFSGASGGGCWKANLYSDQKSWDISKLRLVGTHQGSWSKTEVIDGSPHVSAREVSLGHHLSLIANDYIDLGTEIIERWPHIMNFRPK